MATHRGQRTAADFSKTIGAVRKVLEFRPKAAAGDRAARLEVLALLVEAEALGAAEAERRLREIGDPGEGNLRLVAGVARLRMRERPNELTPAQLRKDAVLTLQFWPDDELARAQAAYNSMLLKDNREALHHLGEGLRRFPGNSIFVRMAVDFHFQKGYSPVAFEYLKAGLKFPGKDGADFGAYSEKMAKAYQPSGGDVWEPAPPSDPVAGCETTVYRAAGKSRNPNVPWDEHIIVCRKDGLVDHAFRHYRAKETSQLWLVSPDGAELLREVKGEWVLKDVEKMASSAHAVLPRVLEAARFRRLSVWPRALEAVTEGLRADPENPGLKKALEALAAIGWEACERDVEKEIGGGRRVAVYRPAGKAASPKPWTAERIAVVAGTEGEFIRAYTAVSGPPGPTTLRYVQLRDDEGGLTVRRSVEAPSGDDLAGIAAAAEPSIAPMRKGLELLALARKHDSVVPEFAEAVALLRQALKTDPSNLHAASELVDAYLAVSDRTRDPEGSDDIHSKVLGALLFLGRLDPDHPSIPLASGILAYRFLNYPHAVEHLKRAGGDRAQEILGLLRQTGQGEYRKTGTRDLDGLQVEAYERVRRPDAEEKGLEGLQLVERCFVGAKGGAYRFTAAYRVQKLGETISRELLLNRFERSYRVRAFDAEPTEEDLAGEVGRAVQSLKGGK